MNARHFKVRTSFQFVNLLRSHRGFFKLFILIIFCLITIYIQSLSAGPLNYVSYDRNNTFEVGECVTVSGLNFITPREAGKVAEILAIDAEGFWSNPEIRGEIVQIEHPRFVVSVRFVTPYGKTVTRENILSPYEIGKWISNE